MVFACQLDSYAREYDSKIVSSKAAKLSTVRDGKKVTIQGFEVVCEDTILFPEGGGQNDDQGWIDGIPVINVKRRGGEAVHFIETNEEPKVGQAVHQVVDWERRFDHMQQHTGQHLISALFANVLNVPTTSWWMADNSSTKVGLSFVEFGVEMLTKDQIEQIENLANEHIRENLKVEVKVYQPGDPELEKAKTRGLPEDHTGPIRVIEIGELDSNMCCGTHVKSLSQLQIIKLLHVENSKRKGHCNLYFIVGGRVLRHLASAFDRERQLNELLSGGIEDHVSLVDKATKNVKILQKSTQNLAKEVAIKDAAKLKEAKPKYFICHRQEPVNDYISTIIQELGDQDVVLLLTSGDDKSGSFQLVFKAKEDVVSALGNKILTVLGAKGGGKGQRLNAKFTSLKNLPEAEKLIKNYFNDNIPEN